MSLEDLRPENFLSEEMQEKCAKPAVCAMPGCPERPKGYRIEHPILGNFFIRQSLFCEEHQPKGEKSN